MSRAEYQRRWRLANPEKIREYQRRYSAKHPGRRGEIFRRYKKKHEEKYRAYTKKSKLKARYGLTPEQYDNLKLRGCAICKRTDRILHADHNHQTTRFRDILCQPCNHGLGLFFESPELLRMAAMYLERHRAQAG